VLFRSGLELVRDQKEFKSYGHTKPECDHLIRIDPQSKDKWKDQAYEIGVVKTEGEGQHDYKFLYDFYGGGMGMSKYVVSKQGGHQQLGKLKQAYATEVAKRQAQRQGFSVSEHLTETGVVKMVFTKM